MDTKKTIEDSVNLLEKIKYNDYLHGFDYYYIIRVIIYIFFLESKWMRSKILKKFPPMMRSGK